MPWNKNDGPLDPFKEIPHTTPESEGQFYLLYYPETLVGTFGSHYQSIMKIKTKVINESEVSSNESTQERDTVKESVNEDDKIDGTPKLESSVTFVYPKNVIEEFTKVDNKCEEDYDDDSENLYLLAYLAGYSLGDWIIGTEMIFPEQHCGKNQIFDDGIWNNRNWNDCYDSKNWILSKSWTAKKYPEKVTIVARIIGIRLKGHRLSSHDLHIMYNLEKSFGHIHTIVVEYDHDLHSPTKTHPCVYTLTEMGREQIENCPKLYGDVHDGCDRPEFYQTADWVEGRNHVKVLDFLNNYIDLDDFGWLNKEHYADIETNESENSRLSDSDKKSEISNEDSNVSSDNDSDLDDMQFSKGRHKKKSQIVSSDDDDYDYTQHGEGMVQTN